MRPRACPSELSKASWPKSPALLQVWSDLIHVARLPQWFTCFLICHSCCVHTHAGFSFLRVLAFRSHTNVVKGHWKRSFKKTPSRLKIFRHSVCSVNRLSPLFKPALIQHTYSRMKQSKTKTMSWRMLKCAKILSEFIKHVHQSSSAVWTHDECCCFSS